MLWGSEGPLKMFSVSLKEISGLVGGVMVCKCVQTESLCDFLFLQRNEMFSIIFSQCILLKINKE